MVLLLLLGLGLILVFIVNFFVELIYRMIIKYKNIDSYKDIGELEREINVDYSSVITSFLYDNRIEPKKDIMSTFLELHLKRVISINKDEQGKYYIDVLDNKPESLPLEEEYVFNCLIQKKEKFNYVKWVTIVQKEYKELNFIKAINKQIRNKIVIISMIIMFMLYIIEASAISILASNNSELLIIGLAITPIIMIEIILLINQIMKNSFFNNMAVEEIKKWVKFKRFMMKYTLIKERKIDEIRIFEKYLPYSISLNINKEYKKLWKDLIEKKEARTIIFHYRIVENIILKPLIKSVLLVDEKNSSLKQYHNL